MDREWKLGKDLHTADNILDGITFDDVILGLHHSREISYESTKAVLKDILDQRLEDMMYLLENNVEEMIKLALVGRNS